MKYQPCLNFRIWQSLEEKNECVAIYMVTYRIDEVGSRNIFLSWGTAEPMQFPSAIEKAKQLITYQIQHLVYQPDYCVVKRKEVYQSTTLRPSSGDNWEKSEAKFVAKCWLTAPQLGYLLWIHDAIYVGYVAHAYCLVSCSCMFRQLIMSSTDAPDKSTLESAAWCHT
jgi:hypothetical protein